MGLLKPLRKLYIRTTDLTHGFQGEPRAKIQDFYRLWARCYDFSVRLDPAYSRELKRMVESVVKEGDVVLDIGCGTGLGTVHAAGIAAKVVGIDLSPDMTNRLRKLIHRRGIGNIEVIVGSFPESLPAEAVFDCIISSFAIVHFPVGQRRDIYDHVFRHLVDNGRAGLFTARGEIASTFETREEITNNLKSVGFGEVEIADVADIYRIVTAAKPGS